MPRVVIAAALLLAACGPTTPATVPLGVRLRPVVVDGEPIVWATATVAMRAMRLRPCDAPDEVARWPDVPEASTTFPARVAPRPATVGFSDPVPSGDGGRRPRIPVGPWCHLDILSEGGLVAEGHLGDEGPTVSLDLDLPDLFTPFEVTFAGVELVDDDGTVRLDVRDLVLELGTALWLDSVRLELSSGADVVVGPDDAGATGIATALVAGAALYVDPDGDGAIDETTRDDDRLIGLVAP